MKKTLKIPSAEVLSRYFTYDPESGKLFWKVRPRFHFKTDGAHLRFNKSLAGREAGHQHLKSNGERHAVVLRVCIDGQDMWLLVHRVIFSIMGVAIPDGFEIDHKDCDPWNNAWINLRLSTPSQNMANTRPSKRRSGTVLPKGVSLQAGRYKAQICHKGHKRHIGMFATPEQAAMAYAQETIRLNGEFARLN